MNNLDIGFHGNIYTWSNKRAGKANVRERLNRVNCLMGWRIYFPQAMVFYHSAINSDHSPIHLTLDETFRIGQKSFHFLEA